MSPRDSFSQRADHYSTEQGVAYRKGFVLGLTLAEAALLLIFVILLLLVVGYDRRDKALAEKERELSKIGALGNLFSDSEITSQDLPAHISAFRQLRVVIEDLGADWDEEFIELVKSVASVYQDPGLVDIRRAIEEERHELRTIRESIERLGVPGEAEEMARELGALKARERNQRGQINELRARLNTLGRGGDLPSCWATQEGRTEFLLDVVLHSDGIRSRERDRDEIRVSERARLPLPIMAPDSTMAPEVFISATRELFEWSVANECRFYVVIYDGTADHEKELYKDLLATVENHFYKSLSSRVAPF